MKTKRRSPPKRSPLALPSAREVFGAVLAEKLSLDDRATLGLYNSVAGAAGFMKTADDALELLRTLAAERRAAARASAERRTPLISTRYARTLALSLHRLFAVPAVPAARPWASVAKADLHAAYMSGAAAPMLTYDAHPGSRAGLYVVDLRTPSDFADRDGVVTEASCLARVKGDPKP